MLRRSGSRTAEALIKLPSLPIRLLIRLERLLSHSLRLLLSSLEHALLAAPDALVRMQTLKDELRRRHLLLRAVFLRNAQRSEFVDQTLDTFQLIKRLLGCD